MVVATSLIEISITYAFAIVFGIAFFLLGGALIWRVVKTVRAHVMAERFVHHALHSTAFGCYDEVSVHVCAHCDRRMCS